MKIEKKNVVLEITVENIPARFIIPVKKQMEELSSNLLKEKGLSFKKISTYATYRRLVLFIEDVPAKTEKTVEKIFGPKASLLKDENGNFTKVAVGFAKANGVNVEDLIIEKHEKKGEVLCALKVKPSVSSLKILSEVFVEMIKRLEFPKTMIWESSKFRFARPIRNILALWGNKVIPFEICGVKSSKISYSSYFTGFKKITIKNADEYFKVLEKNSVVVDDNKRRNLILSILDGVSKNIKAEIDKDEAVVDENLYLCEYPRSVVVKYSNDFTKLPPPLLELVIKKQLKFFPAKDGDKFLPFFVGIRDGSSKGQSNVEKGYLNVFKARCSDALFFYENDLKVDVGVWVEKLKSIIFQGNLGSLYDKKERVKSISHRISRMLNLEKDLSSVAEYVYYDLASNVVNEFSELENKMNYYYAEKYGIYDEGLKKAISEINLPYSSTSPLPSNLYSCVIAISHKLDTLVGDFIIDFIPTGGNDPHGLRRAAIGIFRIIFEMKIDLPLIDLIGYVYDLYPSEVRSKKSKELLIKQLLDFIYQRGYFYLEEKGVPTDILNSLQSIFINEGDIVKLSKRIEALVDFKTKESFKNLVIIYKRVRNITKDWNQTYIDESIFEYDQEKDLYVKLISLESEVSKLIENSDFSKAIERILTLADVLEGFFKSVMVMVEDEKIKNNRLSLLKKVYNIFSHISDLDKIVSG